MSEFRFNKLRGRIVEKYGTQSQFAQAIGISKNALSKKMTGRTGLTQDDILQWAEMLEIERSEIGDYFFT